MAPLDGASAFATIVGLIINFVTERRSRESHDIDDFYSWLKEHGHDDMQHKIESNQITAVSIKALLTESKETMQQRFSELDEALVLMAGRMEGLQEVAKAIKPNSVLSDQALEILRQLEKKGASGFYEIPMSGDQLCLQVNEGGHLSYDDRRFIEDDLETLVELGFLTKMRTSTGGNKYRFRRIAAKFLALNGVEGSITR